MKPGLTLKAFKRLEPYDRKLSRTVLRGRRRWQHLLCYPTLKKYLILSVLLSLSLPLKAEELADDIYILASSSLSDPALKKLVKDAEGVNLPVYFRGLIKNSYKETADYFRRLGVGITIDPRPFRVFGQTQVPAFIFKKNNQVLILKGNVPLRFALEKFAEKEPNLKGMLEKKRGGQ